MKKYLVLICIILAAANITYSKTNEKIVQRGCCSHHGGVCGCSYGRTKCCDGSLSPSCMCLKDDKKIGLCNEKKLIFTSNIIKH